MTRLLVEVDDFASAARSMHDDVTDAAWTSFGRLVRMSGRSPVARVCHR